MIIGVARFAFGSVFVGAITGAAELLDVVVGAAELLGRVGDGSEELVAVSGADRQYPATYVPSFR
jgi:hypothetical protein